MPLCLTDHNFNPYGTLAVDWWAVTLGTARRGLGGAAQPAQALLAVPNVTAHPSTARAPITVLMYNGRLLCGFNVPIKGLKRLKGIDTPAKNELAKTLFTVLCIIIYTSHFR